MRYDTSDLAVRWHQLQAQTSSAKARYAQAFGLVDCATFHQSDAAEYARQARERFAARKST